MQYITFIYFEFNKKMYYISREKFKNSKRLFNRLVLMIKITLTSKMFQYCKTSIIGTIYVPFPANINCFCLLIVLLIMLCLLVYYGCLTTYKTTYCTYIIYTCAV